MMNMTRMLAKDGEGATKLLECTCKGAPDQETAIIVAKSVIRSPLFKCASAAGTLEVCRNGAGIDFSEEFAAKVLAEDEIYIDIDLKQGDGSAKAWGCDLTYDYVKINGDYRS